MHTKGKLRFALFLCCSIFGFMSSQELQCIQKARRLHKDLSMRLEALSNGLPVDMGKLEDVKSCTFLQDIKVLCIDIEDCPCYANLAQLYAQTHGLLTQYLEDPKGRSKMSVPDIVAQINLMLDAFDSLEQWIETREEARVQQVIAEQQVEAESVIDTLEKSTQEIEELLRKH